MKREIPKTGETWIHTETLKSYYVDKIIFDANNCFEGQSIPRSVLYYDGNQLYTRNLDEFMGVRADGDEYIYRFVKYEEI